MIAMLINKNVIKAKASTATQKQYKYSVSETSTDAEILRVAKKYKLIKQYSEKGLLHYCFKIDGHGWFVITKKPIPSHLVNTDLSKWSTLHSVKYINRPENVSDYIYDNIHEMQGSIELVAWLLKNLLTVEPGHYHNHLNK